MHLLFVTEGYPTATEPIFSFVGELVRELTRQGHECEVVAPQSISAIYFGRAQRRPTEWKDTVCNGRAISVHQPFFVSFSNSPITRKTRARAVLRTLMMHRRDESVLYGHFWGSAIPVATEERLANNTLIVATGESVIPAFDVDVIEQLANRVDGVIAVSTKNKKESITKGFLKQKKSTIVLPNAASDEFFWEYDKKACRRELGLSSDEPIALFVGHFSERKGSARADDALARAGGVKSVFLGSGDIPPVGDHCLFAGRVSHELLPKYLAACDMFVLPTLAEGCCNAVVEALAMGVPVISSDLEFNWDVLDESCALLVDPENIGEITQAISKLRDDAKLRTRLSRNAKKKAVTLKLSVRASAIADFIEAIDSEKRR